MSADLTLRLHATARPTIRSSDRSSEDSRASVVGGVPTASLPPLVRPLDFSALHASAPAASGIVAKGEPLPTRELVATSSAQTAPKKKTVDERVAVIQTLELPKRTIRKGMGPQDDIRELKRLLANVGQLKPRFAKNGHFGKLAQKALSRLQRVLKSMGYAVNTTGVFDRRTRNVLGKALATPTSTRKVVKQSLFLKPALIYNPGITYPPGSKKAKRLFAAAAVMAGLPRSWGWSSGLHNILARESNGRVGVPNYTYGSKRNTLAGWKAIHKELKAGRITARSSATGLGQLLLSNVDAYYPRGRKGIGVGLDEAIGMLRYIRARYGNPANAWSQYGKNHEGY